MPNKTIQKKQPKDIGDLRTQIDYLEEQIRQAEMAASERLEQSAAIRSIYKWKAPERIFDPKGRKWYITVAFITILIVAYSALTGNYLLILALIMLLMLLYALNTFPPKILEHEITNKGLKIFEQIHTWNRIESFWVAKRSNQYVLNINLADRRVNRIIILVGQGDPNIIVQELVKRVDYINPGGTKQDILSRLTEGKHIPLTKFLDVFEESRKLNKEKPRPNKAPAAPRRPVKQTPKPKV